MNVKSKLKQGVLYLDGGMGTLLQAAGLPTGVLPETWNITYPEKVEAIHAAYLQAGADVIYANTFGANALKFGDDTQKLVTEGVKIAKRAAKPYQAAVALDIGSLGKLLKPLGGLDFEDAVNLFKTTVSAGVKAGADIIVVETMNDIYEAKAAIVAAKECCSLPIFATLVFGEDGKTMTGTSPEVAVAVLEGLGVTALGLNCSLAPKTMLPIVKRLLACATVPVIVKPNAGLPTEVNGQTVFSLSAQEFALDMAEIATLGARVLGGCCGTTPQYIAELTQKTQGICPPLSQNKPLSVIASYARQTTFGGAPVLIGERINPTGKKRLKQALRENDIAYVLNEAVTQEEAGAHVLDVNVGLPELDEPAVLTNAVCEIQAVTDLPLQIDTSDSLAMEQAARRYNGKPLLNSANGKREVMDAVFPIAKKYGGMVVCLTLDEEGIPATGEGRVQIAKRMVAVAKKYGLDKSQLIFDPLAMAVSADGAAANAALSAVEALTKMGLNTSLGVSNISFGLPNRDFINGAFFACALQAGLKAAIMNPFSHEMMKTYRAYCALKGYDKGCLQYIDYASQITASVGVAAVSPAQNQTGDGLRYCIMKGIKQGAVTACKQELAARNPLEVIDGEIIPALNEVGTAFENKTMFLPQLLMSAEAASAAFDVIKSNFTGNANAKKTKIVIATVQGDIHDIGKNIVKTLLENYGFPVYDLGRDVSPEVIVQKASEVGAQIVALSALMTTTVPAMRQTIALIKEQYSACKTVVGGAVLTAEYAKSIGADAYGKDAMETVRYALQIENDE